MKYRIKRHSDTNWTLQRWDRKTKAWVSAGHHTRLKHLATAALDVFLGDELKGRDILAAIKAAESRVVDLVEGMD